LGVPPDEPVGRLPAPSLVLDGGASLLAAPLAGDSKYQEAREDDFGGGALAERLRAVAEASEAAKRKEAAEARSRALRQSRGLASATRIGPKSVVGVRDAAYKPATPFRALKDAQAGRIVRAPDHANNLQHARSYGDGPGQEPFPVKGQQRGLKLRDGLFAGGAPALPPRTSGY
jgi:hypothetical protein